MANSRIGNYTLEFIISDFTLPVRSHKHAIYVLPLTTPASGTPPASIDLQLKGGGSLDLASVANQYASFLWNFYSPSLDVTSWTLWRYATQNSKDFVTAGTAVPTTTGSGGITPAQQQTLSYRTAGGSILKQIFLEPNNGGDAKVSLVPNPTGSNVGRMASYMLSVGSPAVGIDNTFPVAPLFDSRGENETVWRKIYRA